MNEEKANIRKIMRGSTERNPITRDYSPVLAHEGQ